VWQAVQVPTDPSALGLPTAWQLTQPAPTAAAPSSNTSGLGGRFTDPGW
jgi:hypothetical protein